MNLSSLKLGRQILRGSTTTKDSTTGQVSAARGGKYGFHTNMPGHYPDRVAQHIHNKVTAPGITNSDRPTDEPATGVCDQFKQTLVGGETVRMAEADRAFEEGETTRAGEGGLVVRVQLRSLQPDAHPENASTERVKQLIKFLRSAVAGRKPKQQHSV